MKILKLSQIGTQEDLYHFTYGGTQGAVANRTIWSAHCVKSLMCITTTLNKIQYEQCAGIVQATAIDLQQVVSGVLCRGYINLDDANEFNILRFIVPLFLNTYGYTRAGRAMTEVVAYALVPYIANNPR